MVVRFDYGFWAVAGHSGSSRGRALAAGAGVASRLYRECVKRPDGVAAKPISGASRRPSDDDRWVRPRRRPGYLGALSATRAFALAVVLAVSSLLTLLSGWWLAAAIAGVSMTIVLLFGRLRGKWLTDLFRDWLRFRGRRGVVGLLADDEGGEKLARLRELVPDLMVENIAGFGGDRVGMGSDGAGWFAVLEIRSPHPEGVEPPVTLAELARIAADSEQPGAVVGVVVHAGAGQRRLWVSVRLDAQWVADSTVDAPEVHVDVPKILAELVRRTGRALRRGELGYQVLDADGVAEALMLSCELSATEAGSRPAHESWTGWHSATLVHTCFWLRRWPGPDRLPELFTTVLDIPAALVSLAITVEPGKPEASLRCLIRAGAVAAGRESLNTSLQRWVELVGGGVHRLDGEHAPAVYASAPSGGGAG